MKEGKALVIFSGGQDSSTCLFWAKNNFESVEAISFYYGQRHASELKAANEIASLAEVPLNVMELPLLNSLTENSLTRKDIPIEKAGGSSVPNTLVEGRNLLFLTYAAIYAKSRGIAHLVTGVSQTDYSGYPDCRNEFIVSANATLNLAMDFNFKIHTPLMFLSKSQTWMMAEELGVLEIIKEKTVTCYEGITGEGCRRCPSCLLRSKGLNEYYTIKANERKI
jgi:7-cyano-7-deazaguanine synthase